jgi:drug/metabolite transporter (DMT)-like permease
VTTPRIDTPRIDEHRTHRVALIAAVTSIALQSLGPIFIRKSGLAGLSFAFHRMWLAAAVYAVVAAARRRPVTRQAIRVSAPGGLFFAFNIATFFVAVQRTSVANATVIGALQPVALLMVVNRMFGEKPTSRDIAWTFVSISGVVLVVLGSSSADTGDPVGDLLALAAMLGYAGYFVASKQARATLGAFEYQSALSVVAAITLVPVVTIAGKLDVPPADSWPWLVAMVALPGTGHLLMNYAHGYVRLSLMGVITVLAPGTSAVLAWLLLDEPLVAIQVVGLALAVFALAVMMRTPHPLPTRPVRPD